MKHIKQFLLLVLCAFPFVSSAQVATTAGSNLTAWSGQSGSTNNNNWNNLMNNRSGGGTAKADFGNCNSLILRCAQPKCAGCTTMDIARPIVSGCVNSNATCKKHGDALIESLSAQIVGDVTSKLKQQEIAANAAAQQVAAQQAAAANNAQMQQMQAQMEQMQQQNAVLMQQTQNLQASLEQQSAAAAQDRADLAAATAAATAAQTPDNGLTASENAALDRGVSDEILMRNTISGEIMSKIEDAERALTTLRNAMSDTFSYAGCDTRGNNCSGPKRVKRFKEKANAFIQPYDAVIDATYEALEMAMAVGVDVQDVLMMLNGACNRWGRFICSYGSSGKPGEYNKNECVNGKSVKGGRTGPDNAEANTHIKGNVPCVTGGTIPPEDDNRCVLSGFLEDGAIIMREIEDAEDTSSSNQIERIGCASSALDSLALFGRKNSARTGAALDLDVLERMINQDAPEYVGTSSSNNRYSRSGVHAGFEQTKYCGLTSTGFAQLQAAINNKTLPNNVCVAYAKLSANARADDRLVNHTTSDDHPSRTNLPNLDEAQCKDRNWLCDGSDLSSDYVITDCKTIWDDTNKQCKVDGAGCFYDGTCVKKPKQTGSAGS
ncbi:MAG: hypothetical protein J6R22_01255 [Alphaproteobacteria bacterium]|nr:hypothetical protein [Alphaproteobacteria bacterium]